MIDELQRKHQRELENLQEEKERLLAEETAATIAGTSHKINIFTHYKINRLIFVLIFPLRPEPAKTQLSDVYKQHCV